LFWGYSLINLSLEGWSKIENHTSRTSPFGDILAVRAVDLWLSAALLVVCTVFIGLTLRTQMLLTLHEPLAKARGVAVSRQQNVFVVLLSLVVGVSIKAIGVLLVSAFVVIPACTARLLCRTFTHYLICSAGLGAISAILGMLLSALFNLPSGPSIVVMQLLLFLAAATLPVFKVA
jgi:zinc/manganese transport system permease protein